jgi:V8-like Glu-specific endopeptidase
VAVLRLSGPQILTLKDLVRQGFDPNTFDELLQRLDRKTSDYASVNDDFPTSVRKTLMRANAELWWRDLLREACNAVPDPTLRDFSDHVGFSPTFTDEGGELPLKGRQLELKVVDSGTTFDILTWRMKLATIEGQVCRIEMPASQPQGTGFLIGPDLVVSNYHVVEHVHKGAVAPDTVVCRFDYKVLSDGVSVGPGKTYGLAADWLVDHSGYSPLDFQSSPAVDAPADKLDYAILRLSGRAGDDRMNGDATGPVLRKWIGVPPSAHDFEKDPALNIVQHPDGKPMQVALDARAVIKASATRVRYLTTTERGSSGSPCFSADWKWAALHHSGDPKYWTKGSKPEYNQGIPTTAIVALLTRRGMGDLLKT